MRSRAVAAVCAALCIAGRIGAQESEAPRDSTLDLGWLSDDDHGGITVTSGKTYNRVEGLPIAVQGKLLRLFAESRYAPLGGTETEADVRFLQGLETRGNLVDCGARVKARGRERVTPQRSAHGSGGAPLQRSSRRAASVRPRSIVTSASMLGSMARHPVWPSHGSPTSM